MPRIASLDQPDELLFIDAATEVSTGPIRVRFFVHSMLLYQYDFHTVLKHKALCLGFYNCCLDAVLKQLFSLFLITLLHPNRLYCITSGYCVHSWSW